MQRTTREAVWERARGRCEITGLPLDPERWECHHRRNKGMGGTDRANVDNLSNLLALTPAIHNGGRYSVHGNRPWAERHGYLIPKRVAEPGMWPVTLRGVHRVLLGDDGRYYPLPAGFPIMQGPGK